MGLGSVPSSRSSGTGAICSSSSMTGHRHKPHSNRFRYTWPFLLVRGPKPPVSQRTLGGLHQSGRHHRSDIKLTPPRVPGCGGLLRIADLPACTALSLSEDTCPRDVARPPPRRPLSGLTPSKEPVLGARERCRPLALGIMLCWVFFTASYPLHSSCRCCVTCLPQLDTRTPEDTD